MSGLDHLGIGVGGFSSTSAISSQLAGTFGISTSQAQTIQDANRRRYLQASIIDYLRQHRGFQTFSSLKAPPLSVDFESKENARLLDDLTKNPKVSVDLAVGVMAYHPYFPFIKSPTDILKYLKTKEFGEKEEFILDSYLEAPADVVRLAAEGKIHRLPADEKKASKAGEMLFMLYYRDLTLESVHTDVSSHLISLWKDVKIPGIADLDAELIDAKLLNSDQLKLLAADRARRQQEEQKRKRQETQRKPRKRFKQKVTNQHLIEQFDWLQDQNRLNQNPHNQKH